MSEIEFRRSWLRWTYPPHLLPWCWANDYCCGGEAPWRAKEAVKCQRR
jgi:hypothetical protein